MLMEWLGSPGGSGGFWRLNWGGRGLEELDLWEFTSSVIKEKALLLEIISSSSDNLCEDEERAEDGFEGVLLFLILSNIYYIDNIDLIIGALNGFLFIFIGLFFKIGAAPFHFWSPDVYDSIPTIVTTFVAIVAKISIFIFLLVYIY